jgi:ubiquinone/menaquinone biosynthesis C-methylase UbiE
MYFDVAADAYDRFMGRYSQQLSLQLAEFTGIRAGQHVLDVGCGPGALTAELVRRVGHDLVTAVDPSASFVAAAQARNPGVRVEQAAAEKLPFPNAAFDAALAQLVVHFMSDPIAGLTEMRRVTCPGGLIGACVWDHAGGRGPLSPFWKAVRDLDADAVDESGLAGSREGHLAELLQAAGLEHVEESELSVSVEHPGFASWWEPFTLGVGPAGSYLARVSAERKAEIRDRCRRLLPSGPFELRAVAWAARGNA